MSMMKRKYVMLLLALMLSVSGTAVVWGAGLETGLQGETDIRLQLIAGQRTAPPEGTAVYHVLYSQASGALLTDAAIRIEVPEGMEPVLPLPDSSLEGSYEVSDRLLVWTIPAGLAWTGVIAFELELDRDAEAGSELYLQAELDVQGEIAAATPEVGITVGTQIDYPFFVGFPDGTFRPDQLFTRAETAAVIARIEGIADYDSRESGYRDVAAEHWALPYVAGVTEAGYMQGYDGAFRPDDPITRAELATLMLRLRGVDPIPLLPSFADSLQHWASHIIGTAAALGLVQDTGGGFLPDNMIRRQEAAQFINISYHRGPLLDGDIPVTSHFADVPREHEAFGWIEEASVRAHESVMHPEGERLIRYLPDWPFVRNQAFRHIAVEGENGSYSITGEARVFEATMHYAVSDGHAYLMTEWTTVSEGAPSWAPFTLRIDIPGELLPKYGTLTLELFEESAKDGEKINELIVPLENLNP